MKLTDEDLAIELQMRFRDWEPKIQHYRIHGDLFGAGGLLDRYPLAKQDDRVLVSADEVDEDHLGHLGGFEGTVLFVESDFAWVNFDDHDPETVPLERLRVLVPEPAEPAGLPMTEQA